MGDLLDEYFGFLRKALTPIGLWPFAKSNLRRYLQILRAGIFILTISLICVFEFWYLVQEGSSVKLLALIENFSLAITALISIIKATCHVVNRSMMRDILEELNDISKTTPNDGQIDKSIKKARKNSQFISKGLFTTCFGCILIYALTAWLDYYKNGNYTLPYAIKTFFEIDSREKFYPIFFTEFIGSIGVTLSFVGDTMFSAIILFFCTRIDVLKYLLSKAIEEEDDEKSFEMFIDCVEYHKRILR